MNNSTKLEEPGSSPFNANITFGANLNAFYREALEWMTGGEFDRLGESIHPTETGCWWGAGLYLETFVNALTNYLDRGLPLELKPLKTLPEAKQLHGLALTLATELCNHVNEESREKVGVKRSKRTLSSWEGVVYDTALITRSLLLFLRFEESLGSDIGYAEDRAKESDNLKKRLNGKEGLILSALNWIRERVDDWDMVKYHAGPQDWGMVLRLLALVNIDGKFSIFTQDYIDYKNFRFGRSVGKIGKKVSWEKNSVSFAAYVADRVLLEANAVVEESTGQLSIESPDLIDWGGTLSTAHVVLGLAEILPFLKDGGRDEHLKSIDGSEEKTSLFERIVIALTKSVISLEHNQKNGNWGVPNETAIALQAYVVACVALSEEETAEYTTVEPLEDVTFRALRWLVDANQRFSDGSILHLTTYTAFYSHCLATIIGQERMVLNNYSITSIYDRVLWSIMGGSQEERRKRLILNSRLIALQNSGEELLEWTKKFIDAFCIICFLLIIYLAFKLDLIVELVPPDQSKPNWPMIAAILPPIFGSIWAIRAYLQMRTRGFSKFIEKSKNH